MRWASSRRPASCETVRWALLGMVVGACGRISFDPIVPPGGGSATTDANGDSALGDSSANACSVAIPVTQGVRSAQSTCQGRDLIDACGPPSTEEVLFAFMPPTTKSYNIAAYDPGTANVSNSTTRAAAGCTGVTGSCAAITGT